MAEAVLSLDLLTSSREASRRKARSPMARLGLHVPFWGGFQTWAGALDSARDTLRVELERYIDQGHEWASWWSGPNSQRSNIAQDSGTAPLNMPSMRTRS